MGKTTGFLEYDRKDGQNILPKDRITNFNEFHTRLSDKEQQLQGARCMECGVPFCQAGTTIDGMTSGCPLNNLVPDVNDLIYQGNYEQAYLRLTKTNCFPEFTSRVCPALCEAACTCSLNGKAVTSKDNERAAIEYAFEHDLVKARPPKVRTGKKVAIVGSGPAGLAAAMQLNRRGHSVTVYERSDRLGGLLMYGIPNMKLDKSVIDRRINILKEEGIEFICNVNVGIDITAKELLKDYDRVILACGASKPRDIDVPGRDAKGIFYAVDYLSEVTKKILDNKNKALPYEMAKGKKVLVIGGGDTGNDCVGTVIRLGAASVTQLEMFPMPSKSRTKNNAWPAWPKVLKTDYGQEEAIEVFGKDPRVFQTTVVEFIKDKNGNVSGAKTIDLKPSVDKNGRTTMVKVNGTEKVIPVDLVLIAAGFTGCEQYVADSFGVKCDERTNVMTAKDKYNTNVERVFTAGDMHRGQSLVVWAIREGREVAKAVDESIMGYTNL